MEHEPWAHMKDNRSTTSNFSSVPPYTATLSIRYDRSWTSLAHRNGKPSVCHSPPTEQRDLNLLRRLCQGRTRRPRIKDICEQRIPAHGPVHPISSNHQQRSYLDHLSSQRDILCSKRIAYATSYQQLLYNNAHGSCMFLL